MLRAINKDNERMMIVYRTKRENKIDIIRKQIITGAKLHSGLEPEASVVSPGLTEKWASQRLLRCGFEMHPWYPV